MRRLPRASNSPSYRKTRRAVGALVAGLAVAAAVAVRTSGDMPRTAPAEAAPPAPVATSLVSPAAVSGEPPPPESGNVGDAPEAPALSENDREFLELRKKVFAARPALGLFKHIQEKSLRTAKETATALSILADRRRLLDARTDLMNRRDARGTEREMLRMYQIDFLTNSLAWENHPNRAELLDVVGEVLRDTRYREVQAKPARASMTVDRAELFEAYMKYAPERAEQALAALHGTPLESRLERIAKRIRHDQQVAQR